MKDRFGMICVVVISVTLHGCSRVIGIVYTRV